MRMNAIKGCPAVRCFRQGRWGPTPSWPDKIPNGILYRNYTEGATLGTAQTDPCPCLGADHCRQLRPDRQQPPVCCATRR